MQDALQMSSSQAPQRHVGQAEADWVPVAANPFNAQGFVEVSADAVSTARPRRGQDQQPEPVAVVPVVPEPIGRQQQHQEAVNWNQTDWSLHQPQPQVGEQQHPQPQVREQHPRFDAYTVPRLPSSQQQEAVNWNQTECLGAPQAPQPRQQPLEPLYTVPIRREAEGEVGANTRPKLEGERGG